MEIIGALLPIFFIFAIVLFVTLKDTTDPDKKKRKKKWAWILLLLPFVLTFGMVTLWGLLNVAQTAL